MVALNTRTTIRYSCTPSNSIQVNTARKKKWSIAATNLQPPCNVKGHGKRRRQRGESTSIPDRTAVSQKADISSFSFSLSIALKLQGEVCSPSALVSFLLIRNLQLCDLSEGEETKVTLDSCEKHKV